MIRSFCLTIREHRILRLDLPTIAYHMITIISSTNRPNSKSFVVAQAYQNLLADMGEPCQLLDLKDLPSDFAGPNLYDQSEAKMQVLIEQFIRKSNKFVFVIPEYQGSFPGVLKSFLDGISPRDFKEKKAAIIGVSDGRAGNLRGQDHLTSILNYLKVNVHYSKPKLSQINTLIDDAGHWIQSETEAMLKQHAADFIAF